MVREQVARAEEHANSIGVKASKEQKGRRRLSLHVGLLGRNGINLLTRVVSRAVLDLRKELARKSDSAFRDFLVFFFKCSLKLKQTKPQNVQNFK